MEDVNHLSLNFAGGAGKEGRLQDEGCAIKDYLISSDFNLKPHFKLVFRGKSISKFQPRPKSNWGFAAKDSG